MNTGKKPNKKAIFLAAIIAATFAYVFHGLSVYEPASSAQSYFYEAYEGCKKASRENLRSPATATFPTTAEYTKTLDHIYAINGYVDAQNAFGATVRTHYRCQVQITDEGARRRLISFRFE